MLSGLFYVGALSAEILCDYYSLGSVTQENTLDKLLMHWYNLAQAGQEFLHNKKPTEGMTPGGLVDC